MRTHIDLLGRLHIVAASLAGLAMLSLTLVACGAAVLAMSDSDARAAAWLTAGGFLVVAAMLALWGAALAATGVALRQLRAWAHPAALALGVLNLFVLPFGTALAVYTFWVLLQPDARSLFTRPLDDVPVV
jgi:hypothetical protein